VPNPFARCKSVKGDIAHERKGNRSGTKTQGFRKIRIRLPGCLGIGGKRVFGLGKAQGVVAAIVKQSVGVKMREHKARKCFRWIGKKRGRETIMAKCVGKEARKRGGAGDKTHRA